MPQTATFSDSLPASGRQVYVSMTRPRARATSYGLNGKAGAASETKSEKEIQSLLSMNCIGYQLYFAIQGSV